MLTATKKKGTKGICWKPRLVVDSCCSTTAHQLISDLVVGSLITRTRALVVVDDEAEHVVLDEEASPRWFEHERLHEPVHRILVHLHENIFDIKELQTKNQQTKYLH